MSFRGILRYSLTIFGMDMTFFKNFIILIVLVIFAHLINSTPKTSNDFEVVYKCKYNTTDIIYVKAPTKNQKIFMQKEYNGMKISLVIQNTKHLSPLNDYIIIEKNGKTYSYFKLNCI